MADLVPHLLKKGGSMEGERGERVAEVRDSFQLLKR